MSEETEQIEQPETDVAKKKSEAAANIEELKKEKVNLSQRFRRKSSLIWRIVNIYLVLTLVNLIIFWVITGADKIRLISDKAQLTTENKAFEILTKLQPVIKDQTMLQQMFTAKGDVKKDLVKRFKGHLKKSEKNPQLVVKKFALLQDNGTIIYRSSKKWLSKKRAASSEIVRALTKALHLKSQKNQAFYSNVSPLSSRVEIFMPLTSESAQDMLFYTVITIEAIESELNSLLVIGALMVGFLLVIQGISGFLIYRAVLIPVKKLVTGADQVANADLTVQVEQGNKDDELDQLIYTFNLMVASLDEKTHKLESTISELEAYNEIIQSELDMAQDIQQGILPDISASERITVGVFYAPLEKVSGDYYDMFALPDGSLGILMADVSGHGIPAALITIMAKTHFTSLSSTITEPGELLNRINDEMYNSITTDDYMTAFYCTLSPDLNIKYANASHQKGLVYRRSSGEIEELAAPGFALGAVDEPPIPYMTLEHQLEPGDRLILYSDGIIEANNAELDMFGKERFRQHIIDHADKPVQEVVDIMIADMDDFAAGHPRNDDVTVLIIEVQEADADRHLLIEKGISHYKNKEYQRASLIFETLIANEDRNPNINWHLANCYFFLEKYDEAIGLYDDYLKVNKSAAVHVRKGICYYKQGMFEEAIKVHQEALNAKGNYAEAYAQLAACYRKIDQLEEAREHIKKALKLNPEQKRYKEIAKRLE